MLVKVCSAIDIVTLLSMVQLIIISLSSKIILISPQFVVFPSSVTTDRCVAPPLNYDATDISPQISFIYTSPFTSSCSGRVVEYLFCYRNSSRTTGERVTIATVLLLEDMGENYRVVRNFTVEAIPGKDSCLPGRPATERQCCVTRNLAAEDQFGVNSSYLYGLLIPERANLLDGPDMIQTHSSVGYGYQFNSIQYREPVVKRDLGIDPRADPTAQQVKVFQFIIGKLVRINFKEV